MEHNPIKSPLAGDEFVFRTGTREYTVVVLSVNIGRIAEASYIDYALDYFTKGKFDLGKCNKEWWDVWVEEAHAVYVGHTTEDVMRKVLADVGAA